MQHTPEALAYYLLALGPLVLAPFLPLLALAWAAAFTVYAWRTYQSEKYLPSIDKTILITGCDTGFGHELALLLDQMKCRVYAGCLKPDGEGAHWLTAQASDRLKVVPLDITSDDSVNSAVELIENDLNSNDLQGLWALVNNAGVATAGEIEWVSISDLEKQFQVNVLGTVRVTKAMLPLIRQTKGRVVTMASALSNFPVPGRSAYCMSKFATRCFMDILRYEMQKFGVKCCTINPGNFVGVTKILNGLDRTLDSIYSRLKPSIRDAYGIRYLEAFKEKYCFGYKSKSFQNFDIALDALKSALLAENPRAQYNPMTWGWILYTFAYAHLPIEWSDLICAWFYRDLPKPPLDERILTN